jgi:putative spermidine/putrescine transport system ATP-binding protein
MSHFVLENLRKVYGRATAVSDVSLTLERGESVALLGPSGCGKTTTLRMVAGLIAPDHGRIVIAGADITHAPPYRRNMGYVFQAYALFPHLDVGQNVAFGLVERGVSRAERDRRVMEALSLVRLAGYEARRPKELSGGQQQRVALARALVVRPDVLLLDESLSNLDAKLRDAMRHEIREIQRTLSITTLFVTHDQVEALTLCDRVAVMEHGRIVQIGRPHDIYENPATWFVASFVGRANVLPLERNGSGRLLVAGRPLVAMGEAAGTYDLFLRPQHLRLASPSETTGEGVNRLPGRVIRSFYVGDRTEVLLETAAGRITIEIPSSSDPPPDGSEQVALWKEADARILPREVSAR